MKLYSKDVNLVGQTIGYPDLGDVTIGEELELEVTDEQFEKVEWSSLGWLTKEEVENLSILPQIGVASTKNDEGQQKTKSQEIAELKTVVIKLIDENTELKAKDEQNSVDLKDAGEAIEALNAESEVLSTKNAELQAEIAKLVEENTLLRKAPEAPIVSEVKSIKK